MKNPNILKEIEASGQQLHELRKLKTAHKKIDMLKWQEIKKLIDIIRNLEKKLIK